MISIHSRQAQRILHRANPEPGKTSAYLPSQDDLDAANELLEAGYLKHVESYSSLEVTSKGYGALEWG